MVVKKIIWAFFLLTMMFGCSHKVQSPTSSLPISIPQKVAVVDDQEIRWRNLSPLVLLEAQVSNKLIVIDFSLEQCGPCKAMKATTFKDKNVIKFLNEEFIPVNIEGLSGETLLDKWGLEKSWPTVVFVDDQGNPLVSVNGYVSPEVFTVLLQKIADVKKDVVKEQSTKTIKSSLNHQL